MDPRILSAAAYASSMRISEAFADAGIEPTTSDAAFRVTCDKCETEQRLDEMGIHDVLGVTNYACTACGRSLVGVRPWKHDTEPPLGSGYRLNRTRLGTWSICSWTIGTARCY